jgi:hypothetical protein
MLNRTLPCIRIVRQRRETLEKNQGMAEHRTIDQKACHAPITSQTIFL